MNVACVRLRYSYHTHAAQAAAQEDCDKFCDDKEEMFRRMAGKLVMCARMLCMSVAAMRVKRVKRRHPC